MPLLEPIASSNRTGRERQHPGIACAAVETPQPDFDGSARNYLSQIRHLRKRYAGNPVLLQRAVSELSRQRDLRMMAERRPTLTGRAQIVRPAVRSPRMEEAADSQPSRFARAVVDWFANHVARQLDDKLLHFSRRQELLATADRLGIERFHANLIIAVAQHHVGGRDRPVTTTLPRRPRARWPIALTLAAIQAAIIWAGWRVLHG